MKAPWDHLHVSLGEDPKLGQTAQQRAEGGLMPRAVIDARGVA